MLVTDNRLQFGPGADSQVLPQGEGRRAQLVDLHCNFLD
jgi:hypothetical protein